MDENFYKINSNFNYVWTFRYIRHNDVMIYGIKIKKKIVSCKNIGVISYGRRFNSTSTSSTAGKT